MGNASCLGNEGGCWGDSGCVGGVAERWGWDMYACVQQCDADVQHEQRVRVIPPYAGADCSLALRSETIRDTETQRTTGLLVIYGLPVVLLLLAVLFACCYLKCVGETEDFEDIVAEDRMVVAREKARRAESGAAPSRSAPPPPHSSGTAAGGNKRTQMIAQPSAADLTIAADGSTRLDDEDYSEDGSPMPHTPKGEAIALDSQSYSS